MMRKYLFYSGLFIALAFTGCLSDEGKNQSAEPDGSCYVLTFTADQIENKRGFYENGEWIINTTYPGGPFIISPHVDEFSDGSGMASFRLKIDVNDVPNERVMTLKVIDKTTGGFLAHRDLLRNDFSHEFKFQDFDIFYNLEPGRSYELEFRVVVYGISYVGFEQLRIRHCPYRPGIPRLINKTNSDVNHVHDLKVAALDGLGFHLGGYDAPNANDLFFAGKYYLAWIDQTGFYGKMNGLWLLNGADGDQLDFLHLENGRPVNFLGVAEQGEGRWMANYVGAEHFELPNIIDEPGDLPIVSSGLSQLANWYSMNEADVVRGNHLPWWSSAMQFRMGFAFLNEPIEQTESATALSLLYEGPLTKESDGDGFYDGDAHHSHMLFSDKIRYPVHLRIGYKLYGDQPFFERTYQYRNDLGNPVLSSSELGNWAVIGGFVLTQLDSAIEFKKRMNRFVRGNEHTIPTSNGTFPADTWVNVDPDRNSGEDDVWHYDQSYTLSNNATFEAGHSIHYSAVSSSGYVRDMGGCSCFVHGGLEIGGGVLTPARVLPLAPGEMSAVDTRIVLFPQGDPSLVNEFVN